ncbi:hypothetical protein K488DRAFT_75247, partial [Vararia minispora EC-137]
MAGYMYRGLTIGEGTSSFAYCSHCVDLPQNRSGFRVSLREHQALGGLHFFTLQYSVQTPNCPTETGHSTGQYTTYWELCTGPNTEASSPNGENTSNAGTARQQSTDGGRRSRRRDGLEPEFSMQDIPPMGSCQGSRIPLREQSGMRILKDEPISVLPASMRVPYTSTPCRDISEGGGSQRPKAVTPASTPSMLSMGIYVEDRELEVADPDLRRQGDQIRQAYERVAELERSYVDSANGSRQRRDDHLRQALVIAEAIEKSYGKTLGESGIKGSLAEVIYNAAWLGEDTRHGRTSNSPTMPDRGASEMRVEEMINSTMSQAGHNASGTMEPSSTLEWRRRNRDVPPHMEMGARAQPGTAQGKPFNAGETPRARARDAKDVVEPGNCLAEKGTTATPIAVKGTERTMRTNGVMDMGEVRSWEEATPVMDHRVTVGMMEAPVERDKTRMGETQIAIDTFVEALQRTREQLDMTGMARAMSTVLEWIAAVSAVPGTRANQDNWTPNEGITLDAFQDARLKRVERMLLAIQNNAPIAEIKGLKVSRPDIKYDGKDDAEAFERWTASIVRWFKLARAVGPDKEETRMALLREVLEGEASEHYYDHIESPSCQHQDWTCQEYVCTLFLHFITTAKMHDATVDFEVVKYTRGKGAIQFYNNLMKAAEKLVEKPDQYTIERRFIDGLPESIVDHLIKVDRLQPELSKLAEWISKARDYEVQSTYLYHRKIRTA